VSFVESVLYAVLIVLQLVTLAISVYVLRKIFWVSRFALAARDQSDIASVSTTRQLEMLFRICRKTGFQLGDLPATRHWTASPDFLEILFDEIVEQRPSTIVELGSGASTLVVAAALRQNRAGYLRSIDHDEAFATITQRNLIRLDLADVVRVKVAQLEFQDINGQSCLWYNLNDQDLPDVIDFLIVDGPPEPIVGEGGRLPVVAKLFDRIAENGFVIFDDANRPGEQRFLEEVERSQPGFEKIRYSAEKGAVAFRRRQKAPVAQDVEAA
jgi:predicted O-methyltransferase YrrM